MEEVRMKLRLGIAAGAVVIACAVPMVASAGTVISAEMSGKQIVNPGGGDPDGKADLVLKVNRVKERVCYHLHYSNLDQVTGAFIHKGGPGEIARPIITLFEGNEPSHVDGCVHNLRPRIVRRLKRKPTAHYADITTKKYSNGAVRGQFSD
jgi:hypothetical protein